LDGKDLAEYCIEYGQKLGCDYVEARFEHIVGRGFAYRNGAPISGGVQPTRGIGVRILVNGNMSFTSFDRIEKKLAEQAISSAYKMAKNTRRKNPIDLGDEVSNKAKWEVKAKEKIADVTNETIMNTVSEMNEVMKDLAQYTLLVNPSEENKYLVTSEGTEISSYKPYINVMMLLTATSTGGSAQRMFEMNPVGGWERIKDLNLIDVLNDEVERLIKVAEQAKGYDELLKKPIDMIVGQEVAGIIAHENVGHPSEGDRIMGREGAQAGESFWRDLKIGESQVGSDAVTVSEDPTLPHTGGFYEYDDEGVKARKRVLIKNGVLNEPLLNREYGTRFGKGSNGAARAVAFNREPIIRMANTFFEPGDHSFEELVEDVKFGVYMRSFMEWNIDDRRYQSKYTGSEAYMIKNGEVTDTVVKSPVMELTSVGLLTAVDAISNNFCIDFAASCGKGDPLQAVPVYAGGGEIRFRNIRLGGVG
jgi:TldD protein